MQVHKTSPDHNVGTVFPVAWRSDIYAIYQALAVTDTPLYRKTMPAPTMLIIYYEQIWLPDCVDRYSIVLEQSCVK